MKKVLSLLILMTWQIAFCQQPNNYIIKAGKLFNSETGQFKTGYVILIKGKTVEAVITEKEITAQQKKDYQLIDLSKYAVLPGLNRCTYTFAIQRNSLS